MYALFNVLRCPIQSVYPEYNHYIRPLMNRVVFPKMGRVDHGAPTTLFHVLNSLRTLYHHLNHHPALLTLNYQQHNHLFNHFNQPLVHNHHLTYLPLPVPSNYHYLQVPLLFNHHHSLVSLQASLLFDHHHHSLVSL